MQAFFQNFSKKFFRSCRSQRHSPNQAWAAPSFPHPKRGPPIFLSQKVSRRQACARTRHRQRPLSPTPNAGRSPFSRRKFRAVRPVPEPGIDSALFLPPQTRAAYLPLAESFAPPRRVARAACAASAKKQPPDWATASCVGEHLSSRAVTSQVFSARTSLTSVFGMGTGGPSS